MSFIWTCVAGLLFGWVLTYDQPHWSTSENSHACNWTCMILTLQWPGSFCLSIVNKDICKLPPFVSNWTIHGLWPLHAAHCCSCWPIFYSHLQELEPELSQLWPSLIKLKSNFTFWKDEWIKHGTCAACVETMGSPYYYFKTVLKLRLLFDIDGVLEKAGIKPSCNISYKHEEVHGALEPLLGDNYVLQCVKDEQEREAWVQLKINISKNVTLGCEKDQKLQIFQLDGITDSSQGWVFPGHPCPKNASFFYFPINHEHPKKPCN